MLQGLAEVLAGMLPTGSKLVLHWRDTQGQSGMSAVSGTPEARDHFIHDQKRT